MSYLGIDVGTSGCKAAVFLENGQLLAAAYQEYDYLHAQAGWAELDTPQVWKQIKSTIQSVAAATRREPIQALCISSLGEAVVPVTAERGVPGPSLLNFDNRGAEFLPGLRARLDLQRLYTINGNTLGNHYSLTKLLWYKQHHPVLYEQTEWFLHWSGFVALMLGAEAAVDYSLANRTLLFDLQRGDWSEELLELAQLDRAKLPPTVPAGTVIGTVAPQIARELNLPPGVQIVVGGHDQCCNGVGCGVIAPGQAMYGMGTYICMMPVFAQRPGAETMLARGLNTEHHVVPDQFVSFIYNQGGALVKWYRDTFATVERQQALVTGAGLYPDLLAEMPPTPSRILALPHFTATGPPHFITDSAGVLVGLHLDTRRGEILKGLIEGVTFYLRECLEALPAGIAIAGFRAAGGGSQSDTWLQISADILGRPFLRLKVNEAGALGAAIIAATGNGAFRSLSEGVEAMVKPEREFYPNPERQAEYDERFAKYQRLWPLLQEYLQGLAT